MTTFRLVECEKGRFTRTDLTDPAAIEVRGYQRTGVHRNARTRTELQGMPTFAGLHGPMYDGPGVVRYEDASAYDVLSR